MTFWTAALDRMLRHFVTEGSLIVHLPDGRIARYGDGTGDPVTVRILDPALIRRIVLTNDLAIGEGYMDGTLTIDGDDLYGFLTLGIRNMAASGWGLNSLWDAGRRGLRRLEQWTPARRAAANVAHHYDLSAALYALFLDADRQYSCAYFRRPEDTLETAQAQKKAHIAAKLLLEPGMRVLDIGCGWGGLALTLARDHGVRVLGVTLSQEQHRVAVARAAEAGLSDRVEFRLTDYREVQGRFDRVVSVGMFEHVGQPHYRTYFRQVRDALTPDGVALIHTIGRTDPPGPTSRWLNKYIFPGGAVPALSEIMIATQKEALYPTDIEVWRLHYAETLRHWHDRFRAREAEARALYDERFCRMWRFYLVGAELTFRHHHQCVYQLQLARRAEAVPITRDYLYGGPRPALPVPNPDRHGP